MFMTMNNFADITIERVGFTIHTFKLKRGMSDVIAMKGNFVDLTLDVRARANGYILCQNMSRHRTESVRDAPHMQVVNADHALDLHHIAHHRGHIHITRRGIQQDITVSRRIPQALYRIRQPISTLINGSSQLAWVK